jgi:predicted component of type VI protein secretion system
MPMSSSQGKVLGILKPMGGGDPIPLVKAELVIGRRRSCDICLDFNNISGRHCQLRLINSVWHVRDLGSTNGTSLNGLQLTSEHNVLPDDELGIASHLFKIDYEPGGPESVLHKHSIIEEVAEEQAHRHSLMELAGIESDDKPRHRVRPKEVPTATDRHETKEGAFNDAIPQDFKAAPPPLAHADDDDFLKFIEEDVKKASDKREKRK